MSDEASRYDESGPLTSGTGGTPCQPQTTIAQLRGFRSTGQKRERE